MQIGRDLWFVCALSFLAACGATNTAPKTAASSAAEPPREQMRDLVHKMCACAAPECVRDVHLAAMKVGDIAESQRTQPRKPETAR